MKVLMLNPAYVKDFCKSARWATRSRGRVQRHPEHMLTATAVLERENEVKFVDGAALNMPKAHVEKIISKFRPELTVIHTTTPSIYNDISYAKLAKDYGSKTVLVGAHASAVPDNTFQIANRISKGCVDMIARGEEDYTLRDIASGISVRNILGLSYYEKGKIKHNHARPPILNFNELPFPAWHHIKPEWYFNGGNLYPFITLISARGCFGRCTFCRETQVTFGRKLRLKHPRVVVAEIEYDLNLFPQIKEIMVETDTFTASEAHVRAICKEILRNKLDVTWSANARVDTIRNFDTFRLMKKAGCRMLLIGAEFGTQIALDAVKKDITLKQIRDFTINAKKAGIKVHGCFMIGAPNETKEQALATIRLAKSLPLDTIQFSGVVAYPGTEFYNWAKKKDYIVPKDWTEWVDDNYEQGTILNYPQLSTAEMNRLIDKGLKDFYLRPGKILYHLLTVQDFADLKRKAGGFFRFADYLKRKQAKKGEKDKPL